MARVRTILLWLFGAFFILAGINHFRIPAFYERMIPPYLPWSALLVTLSGMAEIVLGALLLVPRTRKLAAWGIILLLIAVFPANIHMAMHPAQFPELTPLALLIRLPLQLVMIAWAWLYAR
jgi:uncharacterized membrane protein